MRSARAWADANLADVPEDVRGLIVDKLARKGDLDDAGQLIVPAKSNPTRSPMEYVEKKWPSVLERANKPNGQVELEAATAACGSLAMQAELVKSMGVERANDLMALVGGRVGAITTPKPPAPDADKKKSRQRGPNPWSAEHWNVTAQGSVVRSLGIKAASEIAASAGCKIGATRPTPAGK